MKLGESLVEVQKGPNVQLGPLTWGKGPKANLVR